MLEWNIGKDSHQVNWPNTSPTALKLGMVKYVKERMVLSAGVFWSAGKFDSVRQGVGILLLIAICPIFGEEKLKIKTNTDWKTVLCCHRAGVPSANSHK